MRTLKEIETQIQNLDKVLAREIESVPYSQKPAVMIAKTQAAEKKIALVEEIKNLVIPHKLIGVFASGDTLSIGKAVDFLEKNNGVSLDADGFYRSIADLVEPSYSKDRSFCTTQYSLMVQKLSQIATDLGYFEIESPKFIEKICPTYADTIEHVKFCLRQCGVGDQASKDILTNAVITDIVSNQIESKQIPVLVTGFSSVQERNALAVLFNQSFDYQFEPDFEPSAKEIVAIFKGQKSNQEE